MPITITVSHTVSDQTIRDIKTTAAEGGIDYWSEIEKYDFDAGVLKVITDDPIEGDGDKVYDVTDDVIKLGIERALAESKGRDWESAIRRGVAADDAGEIDAEAADVIVQLGLFGEIVYG
ncbi:MAG: hypothetical protein ACK5XA_08500 [Tagaea sp.]